MRWFAWLLFLGFGFSCQKEKDMATSTHFNTSSSISTGANTSNIATLVISQTRAANSWYNVNNNLYVQWGPQYVAEDDNSYAYTTRIVKTQRVYLILQDFGFTIPSNAVIQNITATVRRFKTGSSQVKDCLVHLLVPLPDPYVGWMPYGVEMANPANLWPGSETEVGYSQSGSGDNGIDNPETHTTKPYQWTPTLINNSAFGFYLLTNFPDKNFYYLYFDQVQITVEYSLP